MGLTAFSLSGEQEIDRRKVAAFLAKQCMASHFAEIGLLSSRDLVQELLSYWHGMRVDERLPGRQHLRPEEIRHLLPYIVLYEVVTPANDMGANEQPSFRFRTRLIGTHFTELWGREISGLYLDEVADPVDYAAWRPQLVTVVQERRPVFGIASVPSPDRDFIRYAHLTLPLAADGENVNMLLGLRINLTVREPHDIVAAQPVDCQATAC